MLDLIKAVEWENIPIVTVTGETETDLLTNEPTPDSLRMK